MCIANKEANLNDYILYDSNYVTLWKRQNYGDSKRISGGKELRVGRKGRISKV